MSVLLGDRKESKFEAITYSIELQRVVEIFDVDLNLYNRYVKAIDREIGLIKRWRQRDMAIKSRLEKG